MRLGKIATWTVYLTLFVYLRHVQVIKSQTGRLESNGIRSFEIDYEHNRFLKDGAPFRYVSGSVHYFRVLPSDWHDRLSKLRMAGFNAVQTVVEWSSHEPEPGQYHFSGGGDLEGFIRMAQELGLVVILRVGPFICAEREMGGLPYWLLRLHPNIRLRTSDPAFLGPVTTWLGDVLLPKIRPLLYENGGPVIMVQLENEYGLSSTCDYLYTAHLRDLTRKVLGPRVVLFTVDNPRPYALACGKIPGVYATVDFGLNSDPREMFEQQRLFEPRGPLVNSEFYPGWIDHWGEPHHTTNTKALAEGLDAILALNASVNMYMFHGGTSFGLTAGSNIGPKFQATTTSYDYDAPVSEAGDPTEKYVALREVVGKYLPLLPGPVPPAAGKGKYGVVHLAAVGGVRAMASLLPATSHPWPLTFEQLGVRGGIVVYSTYIPARIPNPARLSLPALHDRGYVLVDGQQAGVASREQMYDVAVTALAGQALDVVVESQGRVSVGEHLNDFKGLTTNATLNGHTLKGWKMTPLPLTNATLLHHTLDSFRHQSTLPCTRKGGLTFYQGSFSVPDHPPHPQDTFLRLDGWTKGMAWVNEFCLGRYWPEMGPQVTLYVPHGVLQQGVANTLLLLELEAAPCPVPDACPARDVCSSHNTCTATLQEKHVVDGLTPL